MQRYRELERNRRAAEKMAGKLDAAQAKEMEKRRAASEVERFENYLELLVSVHKDCGDSWDWSEIMNAGPPAPPVRKSPNEDLASGRLLAYTPGFFEKLFGSDKKHRAQLTNDVQRGREADDAAHCDALRQHETETARWSVRRQLAARILASDVGAYSEALSYAGAFDELGSFKTRVALSAAEPEVVVLDCEMTDIDLVPREEVKLTSAGKVSSKEMAMGRYWTLYQDHVCSCALRAAAEAFAVLTVPRVIVNIGTIRLNTITGHKGLDTLLAVHFTRTAFNRLNLESIDPSDSMKNFPHRMKFKKSAGFEPVAPITTDEQWVTT